MGKKQKTKAVLPWMRSPVDVSLFEHCPLHLLPSLDPRLKVGLENMDISSLYPVQVGVWQETIGPGAFQRDLCIQSPTGSGKTLAYALPIVQALSNRAIKCLRALVVLPNCDLVIQVKEVFASIAPTVGLSVGLAIGQSSIADEIAELINRPKLEAGICYDPEEFSPKLQSSVDILVATPERLMDHINNTKGFTLEHLCYLGLKGLLQKLKKKLKLKLKENMGEKKKTKAVLPWMRSPIDVSLFEHYPLHLLPSFDPRLKVGLENMDISSLYPVQVGVWQETIGPGAFQRDLCIQSPTGSGKTLAYALSIVRALSNRAIKCLRALVVLPNCDLAIQVKEVFGSIAPAVGLSVGLTIGQSFIADEIAELIKRPKLEAGICYDPEEFSHVLQSLVDILVATPVRLMDHINNTKGFTLKHLRYLGLKGLLQKLKKKLKLKLKENMGEKPKTKAVLPWMRSPVDVSLFEHCPLHLLPSLDPRLKVGLENMDIFSLYPVQVGVWQETIGPGAFQRDPCIQSPTRSGKTLAYALPIVQALSNRAIKCLRALVVLPNCDLAIQVKEVFASIAPAVGLSVGLAIGQSFIADEIAELIKRPKLEAGICYDPEEFSHEL